MNNERNRSIFEMFKRLLELRKTRTEIQDQMIDFFYERYDDRTLAYARSKEVVVITHFKNEERKDYEIKNFPQNGKWINWMTGEEHQIDNNTFKVDLRPFDARALVWQK